MIRNVFKIAWRNLWKNKVFSSINILGLAIGLASFILIAMYLVDELSYDRYHKHADRIYRVNGDLLFAGNEMKLAVSSDPMGETLKKDYPEVEESVRIYNSNGSKQLKKGNEYINEMAVAHADSTIFNVFTFPLLHGTEANALNEPNSVVISEEMANKYFGRTNVVGESLETDDKGSTLYKVTAVMKDMPRNGHFRFDFLFSMHNVEYGFGNYLSHNFHTYLLLKQGTDVSRFYEYFKEILDKYIFPQAASLMNLSSMEDFENAGNKLAYHLMPITDIHLKSDRFPELSPGGNARYVSIFSAVAIFILLLAFVNFINLSTASSGSRTKEIGIRKVLGSERSSLVAQFLAESVLTAALATMLAIVFVWGLLPLFNQVSAKQLLITDLFKPLPLLGLAGLMLLSGLAAGVYPAFYMAAFKPIAVLKDRFRIAGTKSYTRNALVVFQFATAIILIIGTTIVYKQLGYIQNKNIGFNKDQVLIINDTYALGQNKNAFKEAVLQMPGVQSATYAGFLPVSSSWRSDNTFSKEAAMTSSNAFNMQHWSVDYEYIPTLGMEMVLGRNFSRGFISDSNGIIINETAAAMLGEGDVIGRKLYTSSDQQTLDKVFTVIGVVKNFNFESMRQEVAPLSMKLGEPAGAIAFKVDASNLQALIGNVEASFKRMGAGKPFSYRFLNDSFDEMYRVEQRVAKLALSFSVLAILIACLGLFGLATFMAQQRIKEIGVRKVLGASVPNIVGMLSKDFIKLVGIASIIAFPIAWYAMNNWLQDFAYRTSMQWWVFVLAAAIGMLIALITVGFQAVRAAMANPVKSLRIE